MNPAATLGMYAGALALVFGAAVGVGNAVGPVGTAAAPAHSSTGDTGGHGDGHSAGSPAPAVDAAPVPGGLAVSQDGYTLQLARTVQTPGAPGRLQFVITGSDGQRVTQFTPEHEKELHLIVVRRDGTGFQHLHPARDEQGRWAVPLTLTQPGPYKVFADFTPAGREDGLTLAADLTAPGTYAPAAPQPVTRTAAVDGYDVTLTGDLISGTSSKLTLSVSKGGQPVTDLQPYLGANGHLVALRDGDLAYLHVHPDEAAGGAGPGITFYADVPSTATYRLFLDFQHAGVVRTAAFTATATASGDSAAEPPSAATPAAHDDGH